MVETQGLEPWTPCLQSRCSSQLSYVPIAKTFSIVPYLFRYDKCIIVYMLYEFSVQSFFVGVLILIAGALGVIYHQKLADNLADGLNSYDKFKFWGLVVCGIGFAVMLSLHTIPLNWIVQSVFSNGVR